ncbi:MAG TPA: helix-turn-helix transcriptional regulator [Cyclobacteriaceae bacterium]|jgi:transcriptional regulator with XRE-family HTH domain|nr:helix-turn-helix transcriptional regulator [Cyclobacteriaceae bacterium]
MAETTHVGRKISRLREQRGIKQETLAEQLGISLQSVSKIEQSEQVEDITLERIAKVLGVTSADIKKASEETTINNNNIQNNYEGSNNSGPIIFDNHAPINPIDKIAELYDALIKSEREKIALLEKLMEKMNEKK